jgi:hypothetical protein
MNKLVTHIIFCFLVFMAISCKSQEKNKVLETTEPRYQVNQQQDLAPKFKPWKAQVIAAVDPKDTINAWTVYRKDFELDQIDDKMVARIAVDSKYWLWVNGNSVVREGGLKRGPTPENTYYDYVDLTDHFNEGKNSIAILVQYFGKEGFSHKDSGQNGLLFDLQSEKIEILSDESWKAWSLKAFGQTGAPHPNYRLPESNIKYDARAGNMEFTFEDFDATSYSDAIVIGQAEQTVWNKLMQRPIPLWKDFGLKAYENQPKFPMTATGDTLKMRLPYNAQVTPYFLIKTENEGQTVHILTDHYRGGGVPNVRAEYVTKKGIQDFEVFGWINGEEVYYVFPEGTEILDLKYRETGYQTEFTGSFNADDDFYNRLWNKSLRTLYITMRDTYMDCPDRERAQWWGDAVLESGEAFYALDRKSDLLMKKGMLELMNWQRQDSTIFSPVPAGNWNQELPGQMLSSVGYYGFYNYYLNTGDLGTISKVYEPVKKYLGVYKLNQNGTLVVRKGGWFWGDWGENKDMELLLNTQYYIALKGMLEMAKALNKTNDIVTITRQMQDFKTAFNQQFWQGDHYRGADYEGLNDDRSQALAVAGGLADEDKFPAIINVLKNQRHASPYMEKYVVEALFQMNEPDFALQRLKERFSTMVNYKETTTLWEGWGIGKEGYGGGTTNHAWSGGGLTLLSQYVAGIAPTKPAYETFQVKPQLGFLKKVSAIVPSIKGEIAVEINATEIWTMNLTVPENTTATVYMDSAFAKAVLNLKTMETTKTDDGNWQTIEVGSGTHKITAQ